MRPIRYTEQIKENIAKQLLEDLGSYVEGDVTFTMQIGSPAAEKLKIYYSSEAYAKTVQLIFANKDEVAWNMVIKPYKDGYKVFDIIVCPQKDFDGRVEVDLSKYVIWKSKLPDEIDANLFGYGHSHVDFNVSPTSRDRDQQKDEVISKGHGFYFFQIWNKRMEINSFFYDIDNNLLYEREDIEMIVEMGNTTTGEFLAKSEEIKKGEPIKQTSGRAGQNAHGLGTGKRKKKHHRHNNYRNDNCGYDNFCNDCSLDEYISHNPNYEV